MKISSTLASVLSLAALGLAAPSGGTVAFPPKNMQPHAMSVQEIAAMPKGEGNNQPVSHMSTQSDTVSIQAACRNNIRKRWGTMTTTERDNYVGAMRCLQTKVKPVGVWSGAKSIWDELVWVHNQLKPQIHEVDLFLPWHRYYMFILSELMRTKCGFTGPHAWWKETNNVGNFGASDIFSDRWFGALPTISSGSGGYCITRGTFAGLMNPISGQCVARGEQRSTSASDTVSNEDACNGQGSFSNLRSCIEYSNHAYGHIAIGPTMANSYQSPSDPSFFLHHSYIDWVWKRWQNQQQSRWTSIQGCADKNSPCTPLSVNTKLTSLGLFRDMTVGELLDTEGPTACYTYDNLI